MEKNGGGGQRRKRGLIPTVAVGRDLIEGQIDTRTGRGKRSDQGRRGRGRSRGMIQGRCDGVVGKQIGENQLTDIELQMGYSSE